MFLLQDEHKYSSSNILSETVAEVSRLKFSQLLWSSFTCYSKWRTSFASISVLETPDEFHDGKSLVRARWDATHVFLMLNYKRNFEKSVDIANQLLRHQCLVLLQVKKEKNSCLFYFAEAFMPKLCWEPILSPDYTTNAQLWSQKCGSALADENTAFLGTFPARFLFAFCSWTK